MTLRDNNFPNKSNLRGNYLQGRGHKALQDISKELKEIRKQLSDLVDIISGVFIQEVPRDTELINECPECKSRGGTTLVTETPYVIKCSACKFTGDAEKFQKQVEYEGNPFMQNGRFSVNGINSDDDLATFQPEAKCPECGCIEILDDGSGIYRCEKCKFENYKEKFYE